MNGSALPGAVTLNRGTSTEIVEVVFDRFTFFDGNTCVRTYQWEAGEGTIHCEWVLDEDAQRITVEILDLFSGATLDQVSGTVSGDGITMSWRNTGGDPNVIVYQRQ